jgi:SnoaL-like domain
LDPLLSRWPELHNNAHRIGGAFQREAAMLRKTVIHSIIWPLRILSILVFLAGIAASLMAFSSRWQTRLVFSDRQDHLSGYEGVEVVLTHLQQAYTERAPDNADKVLDLFVENQIPMVLGTSPGEVIEGLDAIQRLLLWDWEHWGDVDFDFANSRIQVNGRLAEVVTIGELNSKRYRFDIPLRVHLVLVQEDVSWRISTIAFNYAVTIEYFLMSLALVVLALAVFLAATVLDRVVFRRALQATPDA